MRIPTPDEVREQLEAKAKRKEKQLPDFAERDRLATQQLYDGIVDPNVREMNEDFPESNFHLESLYRNIETKTLDQLEAMLKAIDERVYNSITPDQMALLSQQALIRTAYHQRYLERKLGQEVPTRPTHSDPKPEGTPDQQG